MNARALRAALLAGKRRPRALGGGSPTQYRGDGYEFVELRGYVAGDDPRRIDWAATARSGELQTRVVLEDVALTLAVAVDDSASMRVGREEPLLATAQTAARAWFAAAGSGDRTLAIPTGDAASFAQRLRIAKAALPRGAALLAITDGFDLRPEHDELLAALAERCDCTALIARDPWHDGLPVRGLVRFRDAETGSAQTLFVTRAGAERLRAAAAAREMALRARLTRAGWRTGALVEARGEASLYRAFGFAVAT